MKKDVVGSQSDTSDVFKVKNPTSLYAKSPKVYSRKVTGYFANLRTLAAWLLLGLYYLVPWISWNDRQAILLDLPNRQFHFFNITLWPQDFVYLTWLLIIAALTLFFFTALAGRVWCGFACPQTVWTKTFIWIERVIEGDRNKRMKLDKQPWTFRKIRIKTTKQLAWLIFALFTGFTFVGYFSPIQDLAAQLPTLDYGGWELFWILFYSLATYGNAGFLREQVCIYMCPYARFQSAMFDKDTLIIAYDEKRGENRGSRKKSDTNYKEKGLGDCIDCEQCVHVCPTGIDIRDGLQYQCIACAACIDVCDQVMDKMGYEKGLVKYTTEHETAEHKEKHVIRPRTIMYSVIWTLLIAGFVWGMSNRIPFELDVIRDRNSLYTETLDGLVENVYSIKLLNMSQQTRTYLVTVEGLTGIKFLGDTEIVVESGGVATLPIRLQVDPNELKVGRNTITFKAIAKDDPDVYSESESRFLGPSARR
ncbi:MAG: cytochrome c oxidase accessory protein CcoG [Enterobacterales bacterium]|nr:cytochrome c oxidase accessory protein CcoG [Enterobacterales bacterium]